MHAMWFVLVHLPALHCLTSRVIGNYRQTNLDLRTGKEQKQRKLLLRDQKRNLCLNYMHR